ncbi:MAG: glutathione S-transferase [Alphaproteobacteria bacterium]|jgi:glutathione S-transferase|nr:glutathione S-transferase [Alphaproteobacteria bacterium]MBO6628903.1 glutathione S-transferase [Alphaproteobacteria bacterium]MDF1625895.1 glutathione S-transferase [Parvibaculaceae bacterium]
MSHAYQLLGADISYYTGKARAYLRYKDIPFEEIRATRDTYVKTILPRTGVAMIPVLITPDDIAVQDTSEIIDFLETRFPDPSVFPATPRQGTIARLFELYGDEWLVIPAMHYRWNYNADAMYLEFGKVSQPDMEEAARIEVGKETCKPFKGALPILGVNPTTEKAIEASYEQLLRDLDVHFAQYPFLLGTRPSIGDFGLMGPLYAHQYRDPASGEIMKRIAPNVAKWVERMNAPDVKQGDFLPSDEVPETLFPVIQRIFEEQFPPLHVMVRALGDWIDAHPHEDIPRAIGKQSFSLKENSGKIVTGERGMFTFSQWMLQRVLDFYQPLAGRDRDSVDNLLDKVHGRDAMQFELKHRVARVKNKLVAEK